MGKIVRNIVAVLVLSVSLTGGAQAGARRSGGVTIDTTHRTAGGYLASIRSSNDNVQFLDCYTYAYEIGEPDLWCTARDASGTTVTCPTNSPALIQAASLIHGDSYVRFYWNADGTCSELDVDNGSYTPPK